MANREQEFAFFNYLHYLAQHRWPIALIVLVTLFAGCTSPQGARREIIIALENEAFLMMKSPSQPEPLDTGIHSLDVLNEKWQVEEMRPVFPDVHDEDLAAARYGLERIYLIRLSANTNLEDVIREYENDSGIEYIEKNETFEGIN